MRRTGGWQGFLGGLLLLGAAWNAPARTEEAWPWQFGMTPEQVAAVSAYAPYRHFRNGDLETYAYPYAGAPSNVQFFFEQGRLRRIGVYRYEGQDSEAAAQAWGRTYDLLQERYGAIELPWLSRRAAPGVAAPPLQGELVGVAARAELAVHGKVQMAPRVQSSGYFVFASFQRQQVQRVWSYYVVVYYDPPRT